MSYLIFICSAIPSTSIEQAIKFPFQIKVNSHSLLYTLLLTPPPGIRAPVLQVDVITGKTIQAHLGRVTVKTFAKDAVYINDGTAVATGSDDGTSIFLS